MSNAEHHGENIFIIFLKSPAEFSECLELNDTYSYKIKQWFDSSNTFV